jgi:hypothetical protein
MKTYTIAERARTIYQTVVDVFNYNSSSDIVTPPDLIKTQLNSLPSLSGKILVPGAGIGSYVTALIEQGVKPEDIYAVELSPAYAHLGSGMFNRFGVNYVQADFLTWEPEMKFDVIIGNPPYQRPREIRNVGTPLWPEFIEKSIQLVEEGGFVSLVVPFTWMQKNARSKAWKLIKQNDLISVDPNVDWAFPDVDTGGITVVTLKKQEYGGMTKLPDGSMIDILQPTPSNNKEWNAEMFEFLRDHSALRLETKTGPINPSINSSHWSPVQTETHCYEIFYSSAKNRRSVWCDEPIGDWGKLKLAVPTYGDMYGTAKITTVGCGRQVEYILGTQEELEDIQKKFFTQKSKQLNSLMAYGAYHSPLTNVVG